MKRLINLAIVSCLLITGCTSATQPFAVKAMERHLDQEQTIIYDLTRKGEQLSLDKAAAEMTVAVKSGDEKAAHKILESTANDMRLFGWYKVQAERSRSMARVAQTYIWSQKGILNILADEWSEAKAQSDKKLDGNFKRSTVPFSNEVVDAALQDSVK